MVSINRRKNFVTFSLVLQLILFYNMEKYFSIIIGVLIILDFLWCHLVENDLERLLRSDTLFIFLVIYTLLILCCLFNTGFVEIFSYVECVDSPPAFHTFDEIPRLFIATK
jgi:hypothetical protein